MGIKLQLKSARELKAKPVAPAAAVSDPPPPPANDVTFADDKLEEEEKKDDIVAAERKIGPHGHGHKKKELETEGGDTTATVAHKGHDEEDDICSSKPAHAHTTKLKDDFVEPTTKPRNNNNIGMVHYHDDNDDHDSTYVGFDRLFGCFGFGSDDYTASYMSCSTNTEELEKIQEETAEALVTRKKLEKAVIEASKVEKALAAEKAQRLRDIAKEKNAAIKAANEGKKKAWRVAALRRKQQGAAREAAITHYTQAVIKADEAQKASEMKSDKADEVRRRVEKAKVAIKLAKTEAKGAKKIAIKEGKVVERALKELRVVTAQANAARRKFTKFETAAAKKAAKEEAKRAAATRKLVQKMEEEEKQIRNAEIKIRNLREQMKDVDAIFEMKRIGGGGGGGDNDIETDLTLTSTKDDTIATEYESGNFRDVEDLGPSLQHDIEDMGSLLSDMMDEASILLGRK